MNDDSTPLQIPPNRLYCTVSSLANGWSDQYGAIHVAAAYAGMRLAEQYSVRGIWQHGCSGPWTDFSPGLLCNNTPKATKLPVFVARKDQEELLRAAGYSRARAIGLPFVYAPEPTSPRIPGSLLVVPTHTLIGTKFADRSAFDQYADEIKALAGHFRRVTVCVHPCCRENGYWVDEFSSRGFEIVYGAQNTDLNALLRMRQLFTQFESVTTNGWGSHIPYALASGARVSIYGAMPVRDETDYLQDATWAADPQALKTALSTEIDLRCRKFLTAFYVAPPEGIPEVELGRWLIGADLRLTPDEMAETLSTFVDPPPVNIARRQAEYRRARTASIRQAESLASAGRGREAIQFLMRAVSADIASKDPEVIHESLSEIAGAIAPLEPKLSAQLRGEADKIAAANGFKVAPVAV